jgi:hypothetical protein
MSSIVSSNFDDLTITSTSPAEEYGYSIGLDLELSNMDVFEAERPLFLVVEPCIIEDIESIVTRLEVQAILEFEASTTYSDD